MDSIDKIFADFNNTDRKHRIRLNTIGTLNNLSTKGIVLKQGLKIMLDDDDGLITLGTIQFSQEENIWVAEVDWEDLNK